MVVKEDTTDRVTSAAPFTMEDVGPSNKKAIIAQEIKFARTLAGNDATMRRRVLKNLKTWLTTRSQSTFVFSEQDFLRLWKGLFYCMWMSDKPLVQEELAESLGSLVRCFDHDVPVAMQFFKAFLATMGNEWFGIDRWRMDKFMMLVRRVTRQAMFSLHEAGWQKEHVERFKQTIDETILNRDVVSFGLMNHFNDIFLNELAKVSNGEIPKETVAQLLDVFVQALLKTDDGTVSASIKKNIFHALLKQSELGQQFEEKFELWKSYNFVTGNIDNIEFEEQVDDEEDEQEEGEGGENNEEAAEQEGESQMEEDAEENGDDDEEGTGEKVLDPRAGRVNVEIPQIDFDPQDFIDMFENYRYKSFVKSKGKKRAIQLVKQFTKYANGVFPLGVKRVPSINPKDYALDIDEQVLDLEDYREKLVGEKRKSLKERKKERRQQRRLLHEAKQAKAMAKAKAAEEAATESGEEDANEEAQNDLNGTQEEPAADESTEETAEKAKKKRRARSVKMSPAVARKQAKLELLAKKREEKMKMLKERLKKKKRSSDKSGEEDSDTVPQLVPIGEEANNTPSSEVTKKVKKVKPLVTQTSPEKKPSASEASSSPSSKKKQEGKEKPTAKIADTGKPFQTKDEWSEPLKEGEVEYFIPSHKRTPITSKLEKPPKSAKMSLKRTSPGGAAAVDDGEPSTPARKRVKIALNKNVAQDLVEHIKQVKSSPQLPFDSSKKPSKSLLKPNLIPSPINPFYKKKFGLK